MAKHKTLPEPQEGHATGQTANTSGEAEKTVSEPVQDEIEASGSPVYTAEEYASASGSVFGGRYSADIILTALRFAGVKEAAMDEAEEIVGKFANQEVK